MRRAPRPRGARLLNDSPCAQAHNTPVPLERSPPASFKRLLDSRSIADTTGVQRGQASGKRAIPRPIHARGEVEIASHAHADGVWLTTQHAGKGRVSPHLKIAPLNR